jgi:hypothetical protein
VHELPKVDRPHANGKSASIPVTFHLPAEVCAQHAVVCGEWNDWSLDRDIMERSEDGFFLTIELARDRTYRFRYLLDGNRWENDWNADMYVPNIYGSDDSVVDLRDAVEGRPGPEMGRNPAPPEQVPRREPIVDRSRIPESRRFVRKFCNLARQEHGCSIAAFAIHMVSDCAYPWLRSVSSEGRLSERKRERW